MNVFAIESMSCPLTPKSHSLISPSEFMRILEGLTSSIIIFVSFHIKNVFEKI